VVEYVDPTGREYGLPDGTVVHLYGGLAFCYWLGSPGLSELVSGTVHFYEPVLQTDWEAFISELQQAARRRVATIVGQQTGLSMDWSNPSLDRTEWLVIPVAEPELLDRLSAFESGWSRALPPGTHARDLRGPDISLLARRMGLHRRPTPRVDATHEPA